MPRETIHDQAGMYHVTVGWERGNHVQVGIETADGRPIVTNLTYGGPEAEDGSPATTVTMTTGAAEFKSLWSTLDRQGVNDVIRLLRKARDAAFGRDE